jgi:hypothetical protein
MLLFRPDGCACVHAQTEAIEKLSREVVDAKAKCAAHEKEVHPLCSLSAFDARREERIPHNSRCQYVCGVMSGKKNRVTKQEMRRLRCSSFI